MDMDNWATLARLAREPEGDSRGEADERVSPAELARAGAPAPGRPVRILGEWVTHAG